MNERHDVTLKAIFGRAKWGWVFAALVALAGSRLFVAAATEVAQPAGLVSARAEHLTVANTIILTAEGTRGAYPTFSRDGKRLAYLRNQGGSYGTSKLIVISLPDRRVVQTFDFADRMAGMAWSPDATRIFIQSVYTARVENTAFVADLRTGKITPLGPVSVGSTTESELVWAEEASIYAGGYRLDLETFAVSSAQNRPELRRTPVDHPSVELVVEGSFDSKRVFAVNRDRSFVRLLTPQERIRTAVGSADAAYATIENDDGQLKLLIIGTRTAPDLVVEAALSPVPNAALEPELASLRAGLAQGFPVYADIFAPRVNPLNGRTIGVEGRAKGRVRLTAFGADGTLRGRLVSEMTGSPAVGDVLRGVWGTNSDADWFSQFTSPRPPTAVELPSVAAIIVRR